MDLKFIISNGIKCKVNNKWVLGFRWNYDKLIIQVYKEILKDGINGWW